MLYNEKSYAYSWTLCTYYICPCRVYRMFQRWREKTVEVQNYIHYWNNNVKMYTALYRIHISRIRGTILVRVSVKTFHYHLKSHHIINQIKTNLYVVLFRLVHFRVNLRWMLLPFQRRLLDNFTFPQQQGFVKNFTFHKFHAIYTALLFIAHACCMIARSCCFLYMHTQS